MLDAHAFRVLTGNAAASLMAHKGIPSPVAPIIRSAGLGTQSKIHGVDRNKMKFFIGKSGLSGKTRRLVRATEKHGFPVVTYNQVTSLQASASQCKAYCTIPNKDCRTCL